jgi:hypothetical protein
MLVRLLHKPLTLSILHSSRPEPKALEMYLVTSLYRYSYECNAN